MTPLRIANATRVLAETQDEYMALAIVDDVVDGVPMMTSLWKPSPRELKELVDGGAIRLTIHGSMHPPVMLTTQPAPEDGW